MTDDVIAHYLERMLTEIEQKLSTGSKWDARMALDLTRRALHELRPRVGEGGEDVPRRVIGPHADLISNSL